MGEQYRGGYHDACGEYLEYHGGYHDKCRGYLEYRRGVQYHGGILIIMSTVGDIMMHVGGY